MTFRKFELYLLSALTPLHIGVGRAPGTVDLPIARDAFGLPYVPGSSIKGSVKSACIRMNESTCEKDSKKVCKWISSCKCYALYGWDLRLDQNAPDVPFLSPVSFSDAFLLLYPAYAELEEGTKYVYVTSQMALRKLKDFGEVSDTPFDVDLEGSGGVAYFNGKRAEYVGTLDAAAFSPLINNGTELNKLLLGSGGDNSKVYVLRDEDFVDVVEGGIIRLTRVRLDPFRKVVEKGALWSEEYVAEGAVFAFLTIYHPLRIDGCSSQYTDLGHVVKCHKEMLASFDNILDVGGKETIGKGLVKVIAWT